MFFSLLCVRSIYYNVVYMCVIWVTCKLKVGACLSVNEGGKLQDFQLSMWSLNSHPHSEDSTTL